MVDKSFDHSYGATAESNSASPPEGSNPEALEAGVKPDRVLLKSFHLKAGVTNHQFLTYLISVFFSICFVVFLNQMQTFILTTIAKQTKDFGSLLGTFALWDEVVSLFTVCIWGLVSDRLGRRRVFALGFLIMGVSFFLYTLAANPFPDMLLFRIIFALGASACTPMLTAGLADMSGNNTAMTSGAAGMFSGLGAVVAVFVLVPIPTKLDDYTNDPVASVQYSLYIVGGIAILWSIITLFCYQKTTDTPAQAHTTVKEKFKSMLVDFPKALGYLRTDLRIAMGYVSGFVARGDTVILTVFVTAWTAKYYIDNGLCGAEGELDPQDPSNVKKSCRMAYALSMKLSGMAQVFALIGAPIVGVLLTKFRPTLIMALTSLLGTIGYLGFGLGSSPESKLMYLWVCLLGFGEIGTIVTSLSFLSAPKAIPADLRGAISGVYSLFGGLGIIICSKLGGHLFDVWRPGAPFIIMGLFHALLLVMGTIGYILERYRA